jgi:hydroxyethylthiazole kinase
MGRRIIFMRCIKRISNLVLRRKKMDNSYFALLDKVRAKRPLVDQITNFVTVNDCANVTLGIGASPIMADAFEEAAEIVGISQALVLNMGALNERTVPSMFAAGKAANAKGIPVVLDPVGAGASKYRNDTVASLTKDLKLSVIRGNISEIRFIAGLSSQTKGVDASDSDIAGADSAGQIAKDLAQKLGCVIVISGAVDAVSDGKKIVFVENGHPMLGNLTGTGCMCSSLVGSFCGAAPDEPLAAAVTAMMCMGVAGELAYEKAGKQGNGSFHAALHDAISRLDSAMLKKLARYHEA